MNLNEESEKETGREESNEMQGSSNLQVNELDLSSDSLESTDESFMIDFSYHQVNNDTLNNDTSKEGSNVDKKSLLIDTGSTFSYVNNPDLLVDIRKSKKPVSGISNGGVMKSDMEGTFRDGSLHITIQNH